MKDLTSHASEAKEMGNKHKSYVFPMVGHLRRKTMQREENMDWDPAVCKALGKALGTAWQTSLQP